MGRKQCDDICTIQAQRRWLQFHIQCPISNDLQLGHELQKEPTHAMGVLYTFYIANQKFTSLTFIAQQGFGKAQVNNNEWKEEIKKIHPVHPVTLILPLSHLFPFPSSPGYWPILFHLPTSFHTSSTDGSTYCNALLISLPLPQLVPQRPHSSPVHGKDCLCASEQLQGILG